MLTLYTPGVSLASLRRQLEALKRKYARVIATAVLKPVAQQITRLWETAVEKKKPAPDPVDCVHIVADSGFRPVAPWNVLHGYIDHCQRFNLVPDAGEIIEKLLPPGNKVTLSQVFPDRFPGR